MAAKDVSFGAERDVEELELKVTLLEETDLQHELLKERNLYSSIREQLVGRSVSFPRTCREFRASDLTLTSGMHCQIDLGGQGIGDDPIYVYCDMTKDKKCII